MEDKQRFSALSGIAVASRVSSGQQEFRENVLFTHRGLSGPAILQISSYWQAGEPIHIDLLPDHELLALLQNARDTQAKRKLKNILSLYLPKQLINTFIDSGLLESPMQHLARKDLLHVSKTLHNWTIRPNGTEGYRTAEVTLGGVDCDALSSKTMESKTIPGLYFIGEVVDVTGWLGGYNFQWAWSSGWCAGQYV